jgi:hypothetical protein
VEWLKVKALSSNPSTTKKKKKEMGPLDYELKPPKLWTNINLSSL